MMHRTNLTPITPELCADTVNVLSEAVESALDQYSAHGSVYKLAKLAEKELAAVAAFTETKKAKRLRINKSLNGSQKAVNLDNIATGSPNLYSGV
jgi:hypothetical protein